MPKIEASACVLCMISPPYRQIYDLKLTQKSAKEAALTKFTECFLASQSVVDGEFQHLSGKDRIAHHVILEGIRKRKHVLFLYGDVLTSFGEEAQFAARQSGAEVYYSAFGDGTFGRRFRAWYIRRSQLLLPPPTSTKAAGPPW